MPEPLNVATLRRIPTRYSQFACCIYVAVLIYASLQPSDMQPPWFWQADKFQHATAYCLLGFMIFSATRTTRVYLIACLMGILLGGALEVAQSFQPTRMASLADAIANALGILLSAYLTRSSWRP